MNEIKKLAILKLKYKGAVQPLYLFINTYDNSVYWSSRPEEYEYFDAPTVTDIILEEEVPYFEEDAELVEEIEVPHKKRHEKDLRVELVFYSNSLGRYIKTRFQQNYYEREGLEQSFSFITPANLTGGLK
ncbi:hypothetical protein QI212_01970 [Staphylococcus saprophyticus]|nr:hypothetical protein [Staphylococcus saprophyticus]